MRFVAAGGWFGGEATAYVVHPHSVYRSKNDPRATNKPLADGWVVRANVVGAEALAGHAHFDPLYDVHGDTQGNMGVCVAVYDSVKDAMAAVEKAVMSPVAYKFVNNAPRYISAHNWSCGGPWPEWADEDDE